MKPPPGARLFVALWPDRAEREALAAAAGAWTWAAGAARVRPDKLHLTLHFLGAVARERIGALAAALEQPGAAFALSLARPALWQGGVAVLEPAPVPRALAALHAALGGALAGAGFAVETRRWRPHVTLARRASGARPPEIGAALRWRVNGYALVESEPGGAYRVRRRFPLAAATALERSQRRRDAPGLE